MPDPNESPTDEAQEQAVQAWKMKKMIKSLESARGNGTSMISLIVPPKDQISRVSKMLAEELGKAPNIKSRVNRLSVIGAITSVQQRLKLYSRVPPNGLVVYCGSVEASVGNTKKVTIDFEPFKKITKSLYHCDNRFHTEMLSSLLTDDTKFGFIVMDGNGALFGTLCGTTREVLQRFDVHLPKKHRSGGQSAQRFGRIRDGMRHNYVRKVAEEAVRQFIDDDKINVAGLVLAGSAEFKVVLSQSDLFDLRLRQKILTIVDVSYGGSHGFTEAIHLASPVLGNVKFVEEKELIARYFEEVSQDTGKICFGAADTMQALEMGAVETLIVWEHLATMRYEFAAASSSPSRATTVLYLQPEEVKEKGHPIDSETGDELELVQKGLLCEWLTDHFKEFGTTLELITDKSAEGSQFCSGFGGLGGVLRYRVDFAAFEYDPDEDFDELALDGIDLSDYM